MRALIILLSTLSFLSFGQNYGSLEASPTTTEIDGEWTAEIQVVKPLGRVYITKPELRLTDPLLGQSVFSLGLDGDSRKFACHHFGYGDVVEVLGGSKFTGKLHGPRFINAKGSVEKGFDFVFDNTNESDTSYYLTVVCYTN